MKSSIKKLCNLFILGNIGLWCSALTNLETISNQEQNQTKALELLDQEDRSSSSICPEMSMATESVPEYNSSFAERPAFAANAPIPASSQYNEDRK